MNVIVGLPALIQTDVDCVAIVAIGAGLTVTVVDAEFAIEQIPLFTTALNCVVWINFPDV